MFLNGIVKVVQKKVNKNVDISRFEREFVKDYMKMLGGMVEKG